MTTNDFDSTDAPAYTRANLYTRSKTGVLRNV